jgi:hypothetical protein
MDPARLKLAPSVHLEAQHGESFPTQVTLEYIEHSPDPWYSDSEVSLDLPSDKAKEIVEFLVHHYQLPWTPS